MSTQKLVNLMMRSSNSHPYTGKVSKKQNVLLAIELPKQFKIFADKGQTDEAMNIKSSQWIEVIDKLKGKLLNITHDGFLKGTTASPKINLK